MQAAIASLHASRSQDWLQTAALHGELVRLTDSARNLLGGADPRT